MDASRDDILATPPLPVTKLVLFCSIQARRTVTHIEQANEMGRSELHLNPHHVGSPALTTDRSMHPG